MKLAKTDLVSCELKKLPFASIKISHGDNVHLESFCPYIALFYNTQSRRICPRFDKESWNSHLQIVSVKAPPGEAPNVLPYLVVVCRMRQEKHWIFCQPHLSCLFSLKEHTVAKEGISENQKPK
jgi:hypothetical protein